MYESTESKFSPAAIEEALGADISTMSVLTENEMVAVSGGFYPMLW
jgi:hypothetical protein